MYVHNICTRICKQKPSVRAIFYRSGSLCRHLLKPNSVAANAFHTCIFELCCAEKSLKPTPHAQAKMSKCGAYSLLLDFMVLSFQERLIFRSWCFSGVFF